MPFCPFFCPYMNQADDDDPNLQYSSDFRSPDGFPFPGFPGQGQGSPFGPPTGGGLNGPPSGPPPNITPTLKATSGPSIFAIDPGAIRRCRHRFVYIWPVNGRPFWAWITFVGRRSISGFRWTGRTWRYFGMDLREIRSFECF